MCMDTHACTMLTFIGINKEKEICLPNKELISDTGDKVYIWLSNA